MNGIIIKPGFSRRFHGFTIVELLVVIVVIGILATIVIVSYVGITKRATATSLTSDLINANQQITLYKLSHNSYPTGFDGSYCPTGPVVDNNLCLKASTGNVFQYNLNSTTSPQTYGLTATNNNISYRTTGDSAPIPCPLGFIVVPGSATYSTSSFCVMKYAASQVGSTTTPISLSGTTPWVSITQTTAIANSQNVAGCTGCHLITEAEYMTIAQNVLSVASNWSGGSVGSGFIFSGHNNNSPTGAQAADAIDTNGYVGTNSSANQRRTLTLTNGEVIWDIAGNVYTWTQGTIGSNQQPGLSGESTNNWKQWNNGSLLMNSLPYNSQPASAGASGWSSTQGIGQVYSNYGETATHAFLRGGYWNDWTNAGVLDLRLDNLASTSGTNIGFRVSI